jgi:hypothetical protein
MSGWLPTQIVLDHYPAMVWPGVVPDASVRWMYFGDKRLSEPFFSQSVSQLRQGDCPALEVEMEIESLIREGSREPSVLPRGFIFHVSRCGSTLICNALKVVNGIQIVAEARPITRLFMPCPPQNEHLNLLRDEQRGMLGKCLFNLFSRYRAGDPEPIVVKFLSQNSIDVSAIRRLWPNVPCLFVIRHPIDVMVSNLKDGGLNRFVDSPALASAMCGADISSPLATMPVEEFCARVLGRYFDALLGEISTNVRVIDYDEISPENLCNIIRFLHLEPPADMSSFAAVFRQYSKDPTGNRLFYSDRLEKLKRASPRILEAANRWVIPQYTQLRSVSMSKQGISTRTES